MSLFCYGQLPIHLLKRFVTHRDLFSKKEISYRKILLCNQASLGDAFLTTTLLPVLADLFPEATFGVLTSHGSAVVFNGCPHISYVHTISHWMEEKVPLFNRFKKLLHFHKVERPRLVVELKEMNYDCALNCYPFFSDTISLFLSARIPHRILFNTSGYEKLSSHLVSWEFGKYLPHLYWKMAQTLGATEDQRSLLASPWLSILPSTPPSCLPSIPYILIHTSSSMKEKDLDPPFWKELLAKLLLLNCPIFFTGKGESQDLFIREITSDPAMNLCNRLSWPELLSAVKHSALVISVDTVILHLAAALNRPWIGLYRVTRDLDLWRPEEENGRAFVEFTPLLASYLLRKDSSLRFTSSLKTEEIAKEAQALLKGVRQSESIST